jgi:hypothetical protein
VDRGPKDFAFQGELERANLGSAACHPESARGRRLHKKRGKRTARGSRLMDLSAGLRLLLLGKQEAAAARGLLLVLVRGGRAGTRRQVARNAKVPTVCVGCPYSPKEVLSVRLPRWR